MKVFELSTGMKFRIVVPEGLLPEVFTFNYLDGSYGTCFDNSNSITYIAAYSEVALVTD